MRAFLLWWVLPVGSLVAWLLLAERDMHLGLFFLSRETYDQVFGLYGQILGMEADALPPLVKRALVVDTLIVLAIFAFRRRKSIVSFLRSRSQARQPVERALQDEGRGRRIDALGALGPGNVGGNQNAFGRRSGKPLVPEGEGPLVQP